MQTLRFSKLFLFCGIAFLPLLSHAQTPEAGESQTTATEEEKIDQVIEDAKKALEEPAPAVPAVQLKEENKLEATDGNGGKAIVTLSPSSKPTQTTPHAKVIQSAGKTKAKVAKKSVKKEKASVAQNSAKPKNALTAPTTKQYAKATPKPAHPTGSTGPLSAFELGRYQYCGEDRDCMFAVHGCCD